MGFYNCMFVLNKEQTFPEFFEYHKLIQGYFGIIKVIYDIQKHRQLMKTIYNKLGARFRPYYNMVPIPRETILSAAEVAEKYAAFQDSHPDSEFDLEEFLVEKLQLDLAEDGSAFRDFIFQKENEETFEGRFDSFSVDASAMLLIGKDCKEYSIIKVKDLDVDRTIYANSRTALEFEFVLDTNGKMFILAKADTAAEMREDFINYISSLDPEDTLVMTQIHD